jgi:hypothetical protein
MSLMARMEFKTAVEKADAEAKGEAPEPFEFTLAGQEFVAALPSATQLSMLAIAIGDGGKAALETALNVFDGLLEGNGGARLRKLIANGTVKPSLLFWGDELNDQGIIGALVAQVTGRPTTPSSDSSATPKTSGRRSTGRAPGKGSTRSTSPETDS